MYTDQRSEEYIKFFFNLKEAEEYAVKLTTEYIYTIKMCKIKKFKKSISIIRI